MKCSKCGFENQPEAQICSQCKSPLLSDAANVTPPQYEALSTSISNLWAALTKLEDRLGLLEHKLNLTAAAPAQKTVEEKHTEAVQPVQTVPEKVMNVNPPKVKQKNGEWEQIMGGNWLAKIGIVALVIGVGFFLKFAFDNNWIGPTGQVVIGIIAGLGLLGLAFTWRKKYSVLTQVLSGGAIAILYLSIFAAFSFYNLIHFYVAVVFIILVNVLSALLALKYNSVSLAVIGILGAFLAPLILDPHSSLDTVVRGYQTLVYIVLMDIGVLFLTTFRQWRWFNLFSFVLTFINFGWWYFNFSSKAGLVITELGLTTIFLIFMCNTFLFNIIWKKEARSSDYILMVMNSVAYCGISFGIMNDHFGEWMGGFFLLVAVLYGLVAYIILRRNKGNVVLSLFNLSLSIILVTLAIVVQFGEYSWLTIIWAVEGTILIWLATILRMNLLKIFGIIVFFIVLLRLMIVDTGIRTGMPVFNERFLLFVIGIAGFYISGWLMLKNEKAKSGDKALPGIFFALANFLTIWMISAEIIIGFDNISRGKGIIYSDVSSAKNLVLSALWTIYAVAGLAIGIVKRWLPVRIGALCLLCIAIVKVFVFDVFVLDMGYRIGAFIGLGLLLIASAYLYQRYKKVIRGVFIEK